MDDASTSAVCEALGGEKRTQASDAERKRPLRDEVKNTADRAKTPVAPMSRQNIQYLEDKNKITADKSPEEATDARERARSNCRKRFSAACARKNQEERVVSELQLNFDATQSTVGDRLLKRKAGRRVGPVQGGGSKRAREGRRFVGESTRLQQRLSVVCRRRAKSSIDAS